MLSDIYAVCRVVSLEICLLVGEWIFVASQLRTSSFLAFKWNGSMTICSPTIFGWSYRTTCFPWTCKHTTRYTRYQNFMVFKSVNSFANDRNSLCEGTEITAGASFILHWHITVEVIDRGKRLTWVRESIKCECVCAVHTECEQVIHERLSAAVYTKVKK